MKPLISIQILNWNRADETQRAIKSALNQSYPNTEVILIDNGSTDGSVALTKENFPDIEVIELDKNYGCAGGRNLGIPHCNGDYIFYLDNDGVLHKDAVYNAYESIKADPNIGIVTGIVYDFDNTSEINPVCPIKNYAKYKVNVFQGGISLHNKKIYSQTGYYPAHFMYGQEETFLSLKLFDTNYYIIKDESVVLWHRRSEFARNRSREILLSYFNKLYIAVSTYPIKYTFLFILYFIFRYPVHALKQNVFLEYITKFPVRFSKTILVGLKNRKPISVDGYDKYSSFQKN